MQSIRASTFKISSACAKFYTTHNNRQLDFKLSYGFFLIFSIGEESSLLNIATIHQLEDLSFCMMYRNEYVCVKNCITDCNGYNSETMEPRRPHTQTRIVKLPGLPEILHQTKGMNRVINATVKPAPRQSRPINGRQMAYQTPYITNQKPPRPPPAAPTYTSSNPPRHTTTTAAASTFASSNSPEAPQTYTRSSPPRHAPEVPQTFTRSNPPQHAPAAPQMFTKSSPAQPAPVAPPTFARLSPPRTNAAVPTYARSSPSQPTATTPTLAAAGQPQYHYFYQQPRSLCSPQSFCSEHCLKDDLKNFNEQLQKISERVEFLFKVFKDGKADHSKDRNTTHTPQISTVTTTTRPTESPCENDYSIADISIATQEYFTRNNII